MGKRSSFERFPRDFYPTPLSAVLPLLRYLKPPLQFVEPCAGKGHLVRHLEQAGLECVGAWDIKASGGIQRRDARVGFKRGGFDCFITNPPWDRKILHPIIENLSAQKRTWLLLDA